MMMKKNENLLIKFVKANIAFTLGTIFGAVISSLTTVAIFTSIHGVENTLTIGKVICGG